MRVRWNQDWDLREAQCKVDPGGEGGGSGPSGSPGSSPSGAPDPAPASSGSTSGAGAAGASPSPAPATPPASDATPPASPVDAGGGDSFDFESIFGDGPEPAPEPKPAVAPAQPPAAAPPPQPAQAQPPQPPATAQPTPQPSTGGQEPASVLDASDPASIAHHLALHKDAAIAHIAEQVFKLSPEDVEALETDTVGTIPKLLAKTFVEMQGVMLGQMARLVPQIVQRHSVATAANAEAEKAFFSMWPSLDQSKHSDLVRRYAVTYRQMHPQATREQMFSDLGPIVMMAARVAPTPAASVPRNSPKPSPFVPAGGGVAEPNNAPGLTPIEAMFLHNE